MKGTFVCVLTGRNWHKVPVRSRPTDAAEEDAGRVALISGVLWLLLPNNMIFMFVWCPRGRGSRPSTHQSTRLLASAAAATVFKSVHGSGRRRKFRSLFLIRDSTQTSKDLQKAA